MNRTFVPKQPNHTQPNHTQPDHTQPDHTQPDHTQDVLSLLSASLQDFTPQVRKAATFVLENPNQVGVSSIRELADAAEVKPNTLVRLAQNVGFEAYEAFRKPFRQGLLNTAQSFPDRARWIQTLPKEGDLQGLYAEMAAASIANIENLFGGTSPADMRAAANLILNAKRTYVLGVGIANAVAHNFAYTAGMAVDHVVAIPREGSLPVDDLARANTHDVVLAMTFSPYRREVVEAVTAAREQGVNVIAVSDSPASPIFQGAAHQFHIPVDTPQFFTSTIALAAFLETLVAYITAEAGPAVVENIEQFHARRHALGIYVKDGR